MRIKSFLRIFLTGMLMTQIFCSGTKTDSQPVSEKEKYRRVAKTKFGDRVEYLFNQSKNFVICFKKEKPTPQIPQNRLSFFVYNLETDEIIFEDTLTDGEVSWKSNTQFRVRTTPGMLTVDPEYNQKLTGYVFDVTLKRKIDH